MDDLRIKEVKYLSAKINILIGLSGFTITLVLWAIYRLAGQ